MRPRVLLLALLLAVPGPELLASTAEPAGAATATSPAQGRGRGRAGGSRQRGGGGKRSAPRTPRQRSIAGRSPGGAGLLGAGRPVDVVPPGPSLEEYVQRAPRPSLGEEPHLDLADEERLAEWFAVADYDENEWISYREASRSMEFDRARFRLYDPDRDGRLTRPEFDFFYTDSMRLFGSFLAPEPEPVQGKAPQRTAEQLRNAYDTDLDGALSLFELARLLHDYRRLELDAGEVLRFVDRSGDERLDVEELVEVQGYLYPVTRETAPEEGPEALPASLEELFDEIELRGTEVGGTPYPPRIVGPVHPFRRLDLDGDGYVSVHDLEELLRPIRIGIRPAAVLNTLDRDGDGRLSFDELGRAFVDAED